MSECECDRERSGAEWTMSGANSECESKKQKGEGDDDVRKGDSNLEQGCQ